MTELPSMKSTRATPSSGSLAVAVKVTEVGVRYDIPFAGEVSATLLGGWSWAAVTVDIKLPLVTPKLSIATACMVYVPAPVSGRYKVLL